MISNRDLYQFQGKGSARRIVVFCTHNKIPPFFDIQDHIPNCQRNQRIFQNKCSFSVFATPTAGVKPHRRQRQIPAVFTNRYARQSPDCSLQHREFHPLPFALAVDETSTQRVSALKGLCISALSSARSVSSDIVTIHTPSPEWESSQRFTRIQVL